MQKPQLFMFHFAGGNCNSFNFMNSYLKEFVVETIELPGRGMRSGEVLLKDFNIVAKDLYKHVKKRLASDSFILYGHSMGALFALKIAHMLEMENLKPLYLITTGNPGPGIKTEKGIYLLNNEDFISEVKKLGGLPSEFLENQELLDYFIPIFRADFELAEKNNLDFESTINAPIYSVMGDSEKYNKDIINWLKYTRSSFNYEVLKGNHFFIYEHAERISDLIKKCYHDAFLNSCSFCKND